MNVDSAAGLVERCAVRPAAQSVAVLIDEREGHNAAVILKYALHKCAAVAVEGGVADLDRALIHDGRAAGGAYPRV